MVTAFNFSMVNEGYREYPSIKHDDILVRFTLTVHTFCIFITGRKSGYENCNIDEQASEVLAVQVTLKVFHAKVLMPQPPATPATRISKSMFLWCFGLPPKRAMIPSDACGNHHTQRHCVNNQLLWTSHTNCPMIIFLFDKMRSCQSHHKHSSVIQNMAAVSKIFKSAFFPLSLKCPKGQIFQLLLLVIHNIYIWGICGRGIDLHDLCTHSC